MAKKPKPPVRRSPNSSVWLQIAIVGLWTALAQWFLWDKLYFTGDEPHYMMSVVSFVLDGDFNNYNNYQRGHSALFGVSDLQPQWAAYGFPRPGLIPAEHGTAFPLLISPIFRLWGIDGLRVAFIVCSAVACLLSGWTAKTLSGSVAVGWGALGLLLIAPVWQMQASRIYPETLAALLVALITAILTLHVKDLKRGPRGWLLFTCGFCIILLPILYAKYVVIGAGFGIACLLLPSIRSRPAFWAGLGLALLLGLFNAWMWAEQGAIVDPLGGNSGKSDIVLFSPSGWLEKFWKSFLDRHHGIVPYEPYTFLSIWALIFYLKLPDNENQVVLGGMALALLFFTGLHGFWNLGPAFSGPGRYLISVLPILCTLLAMWAAQKDPFQWVRLSLIGVGCAVALAHYAASVAENNAPYFVLQPFHNLFGRYWLNWNPGSAEQVTPVGLLAWYLALLVVVTKLAALIWHLRQNTQRQKLAA